MHLLTRYVAAFSFFWAFSEAQGKGLNDLAPEETKEGTSPSSEVSGSETEAKEPEGEEQESTEDATAEGKATDQGPESEAETAKPAYQMPKALKDKLILRTSFSWGDAKGSDGKWGASGVSDIAIAYALPIAIGKIKLHGLFRYTPFAVHTTLNGTSFQGVIEGYHGGVSGTYSINKKLNAEGFWDVGYGVASFRKVDSTKPEKFPEESGVISSLGGAFRWTVVEGFSFGPQIAFGFGSYSTMQVGASAGFHF